MRAFMSICRGPCASASIDLRADGAWEGASEESLHQEKTTTVESTLGVELNLVGIPMTLQAAFGSNPIRKSRGIFDEGACALSFPFPPRSDSTS